MGKLTIRSLLLEREALDKKIGPPVLNKSVSQIRGEKNEA